MADKTEYVESFQNSNIVTIDTAIETQSIYTENGYKVLQIREFNPQTNKGVYLVSENRNCLFQGILTLEKDGKQKEVEIFGKLLKDPLKAETEREAYTRCSRYGVPSLNFLCTIETEEGFFNITETENYLLPYSLIKIEKQSQYQSMVVNGINAIRKIHQLNIHHRDTLTRNLATFTNRFKNTIVFDFESSNLYQDSNKISMNNKFQDYELFTESLFFQVLKQNPQNKDLIRFAEKFRWQELT